MSGDVRSARWGRLSILAVCALLVLAGCSATGGNASGNGAGTTVDATATNATATADRTTTAALGDLPPGETLLSEHRRALDRAGTFTLVGERTVTGADRQVGRSAVKVNLSDGRYLSNRTPMGNLAPQSTYVAANGSGYLRRGRRTTEVDPERTAEQFVVPPDVRQVLANASKLGFSPVGRTEVEGTPVAHYATNDTAAFRDLFGGSGATVRDAEAHLYRREDGLLKRVTVRVRIERSGRTTWRNVTYIFLWVGETTVPVPDWAGNGSDSAGSLLSPRSPSVRDRG